MSDSMPLEGDPFPSDPPPPPAPGTVPDPAEWTPDGHSAGWSAPTGTTPDGPPVPSYGSGGKGATVVDTQALAKFAANMGELANRVRPQIERLHQVNVAPGGFSQAFALKNKVNGGNGSGGLAGQYDSVLNQLLNGLLDLQTGMHSIIEMYTTANKATKVTADQLKQAMTNATNDFGGVVKPTT